MIKELSKIKVWQQYKRSDAVVNYFAFLRDYIQENYNDLFFKYNKDTKQIELGEYGKEFSINQAQTEYLQYYLESVYGMKRPHYLVDRTYYDSGLKYDSFYKYDEDGTAELVPIPLLKKYLLSSSRSASANLRCSNGVSGVYLKRLALTAIKFPSSSLIGIHIELLCGSYFISHSFCVVKEIPSSTNITLPTSM